MPWNRPVVLYCGDWGGCDRKDAKNAMLRAGGDPKTMRHSCENHENGQFHMWEGTAPWWRHRLALSWWWLINHATGFVTKRMWKMGVWWA